MCKLSFCWHEGRRLVREVSIWLSPMTWKTPKTIEESIDFKSIKLLNVHCTGVHERVHQAITLYLCPAILHVEGAKSINATAGKRWLTCLYTTGRQVNHNWVVSLAYRCWQMTQFLISLLTRRLPLTNQNSLGILLITHSTPTYMGHAMNISHDCSDNHVITLNNVWVFTFQFGFTKQTVNSDQTIIVNVRVHISQGTGNSDRICRK